MINTIKQDYIWASSHFLTKQLPSDYDEWEEEKFHKFLEENVWQPFECYDPIDIWEHITSLAWSVRKYIQEENRTNKFKENVIKYMENKKGVRL
tara:strand:+ start:198 stop:479 length:282 start_codon:yes stop_codon:yes gene_type:complete